MNTLIIECQPGLQDGNWRFYCPHCKRDHVHGGGEGLRGSHCDTPSSPYHNEGYYLVLEGSDWEGRHAAGELAGRPWTP